MKKLNDRGRRRLDERLAIFHPARSVHPPLKGWIRAIRDGLGMSGAQLGRRMGGISAQTVSALERSEAAGTIQLQSLEKAAHAMGCQLVYALVPDVSLEQAVQARARQIALKALGRVAQTMKLEAQGTDLSDLEERLTDYIKDHLNDRDLWNDR